MTIGSQFNEKRVGISYKQSRKEWQKNSKTAMGGLAGSHRLHSKKHKEQVHATSDIPGWSAC